MTAGSNPPSGSTKRSRLAHLAPPPRLLAPLSWLALTACPGPRQPTAPPPSIAPQTLEIGRSGATLAGVAGDGATVYVALSSTAEQASAAAAAATPPAAPAPAVSTTIEAISQRAFRADAPIWQTTLTGRGGPLVTSSGLVIAALAGGPGPIGSVAGHPLSLRGEPGAALVALRATTGAPTWALAVDATEWSVITALAAAPDGAIVGGSFSGTLRIGQTVVSSAGKADGFVARIITTGATCTVAWLIRLGGPGADAVQGVAATADRIAIAGTFVAGAEILGHPLTPFDDRSPASDAFVAELDPAGRLRWADQLGGADDETVAGVAIDARGRIAVAATVRDTVHFGTVDLVAKGPADGLIAWWAAGGAHGPAILVGGSDFDGLRAITAAGDRVVVAGFFSGSLRLGSQPLTAAGGDDAFLAAYDAGQLTEAWPVSGDGREEITALSAIPGGFVAGISHTAAARIGTDALPSPRDPLGGAALAIRPVR